VGGGGGLRRVDAGGAAGPAAAGMLAFVPERTSTAQTWYSAAVCSCGHMEARARKVVSVALPRALKKGVSLIDSTALGPVAVARFGGASHYAARPTPIGWPGGRWRTGRRGGRVTPRCGQVPLSVLVGILIDCGSFAFVCQFLELSALQ